VILWFAASAFAGGRLHVTIDSPAVVKVDDVAITAPADTWGALDVEAGRHSVSVSSGSEQELWSGLVDVPDGYEVRCAWAAGAFACHDAVALAEAPVVTESASTSRTPASVAVAGGTEGVSVAVSGATSTTTRSTTTTIGPRPAVKPPGKQPGYVEIVVRSLDHAFVDVLVDGIVVLELRTSDTASFWIPPGAHTIAFSGFLAPSPYASGRLEAVAGAPITFSVREGRAPRCSSKSWDPSR
jgi:hypothetical protein